jgi:hypothetical protein
MRGGLTVSKSLMDLRLAGWLLFAFRVCLLLPFRLVDCLSFLADSMLLLFSLFFSSCCCGF